MTASSLERIDYDAMQQICCADWEFFTQFGEVTQTANGPYIYKDNGPDVKILAIAHLDTVQDVRHFYACAINGGTMVMNAQLDDRLGAYVLIDLLPKLGLKYDLLLTVGEEQANTTAENFATDKSYNWIFQFDRSGDDAVHYQYYDTQWLAALRGAGFKVAHGSYSDICAMEHLGVCGVNVGVGYYNNHSVYAYAHMEVMAAMVDTFLTFFELYSDTPFPFHPVKTPRSQAGGYWSKSQERWITDEEDDWYWGQSVHQSRTGPDGEDQERYTLIEDKTTGKFERRLLSSGTARSRFEEEVEEDEEDDAPPARRVKLKLRNEMETCPNCGFEYDHAMDLDCMEARGVCTVCFEDMFGRPFSLRSLHQDYHDDLVMSDKVWIHFSEELLGKWTGAPLWAQNTEGTFIEYSGKGHNICNVSVDVDGVACKATILSQNASLMLGRLKH